MPGGLGKIDLYNKTTSKEKLSEVRRKGGRNSVKKRREKKALQELVRTILEMPIERGAMADVDEMTSLDDMVSSNVSVKAGIIMAAVKKGLEGDTKAATMLFEIVGDKVDKQKVEVKSETPLAQTVIYLPDNGRDK